VDALRQRMEVLESRLAAIEVDRAHSPK
jgi:hypothetical protein